MDAFRSEALPLTALSPTALFAVHSIQNITQLSPIPVDVLISTRIQKQRLKEDSVSYGLAWQLLQASLLSCSVVSKTIIHCFLHCNTLSTYILTHAPEHPITSTVTVLHCYEHHDCTPYLFCRRAMLAGVRLAKTGPCSCGRVGMVVQIELTWPPGVLNCTITAEVPA